MIAFVDPKPKRYRFMDGKRKGEEFTIFCNQIVYGNHVIKDSCGYKMEVRIQIGNESDDLHRD